MIARNKYYGGKGICTIAGACILVFIGVFSAAAQEKLPHPITVSVTPTQGLKFGAFTGGTPGGTVIVYPTGVRSSTGSVVLLSLGYTFSPATFNIEANPGTVVSILNGADAILTGSGGGTMTLHLGSSTPSSPLVTTANPPATTTVNIGGTLTVGSPGTNPNGAYSGVFSITFIQE